LDRHVVGAGADGDAQLHLLLQPADADHEELVEVRLEDGQELEALQGRHRRVARLFEDAAVELEPAQLAVEIQRRVIQREGRRSVIGLHAGASRGPNPHYNRGRRPRAAGGAIMSQWVLAEQTHAAIRVRPWQAAVLPFGATEPHNLHMPYGTDTFQVEELARRACARAYEAGARVVLLPTVPFGVNTNHLRVPGALALSVTPTTLLRVLADLVD